MLKKVGVSLLICVLCAGCFEKGEEKKTGYDQITLNTLLLNYVSNIEQEITLSHIEGNKTSFDGTYSLKEGILTNEEGVTLKTPIKSTKEDQIIFKIENYKVIYAELDFYTNKAIYENGRIKGND